MQKTLLFRPVRELSGECQYVHDSVEASTATTSVSAMETRHAHPELARQFAASGIGRPLRSSASVCNLNHVALRRSGCPTGWTRENPARHRDLSGELELRRSVRQVSWRGWHRQRG